MYNNGSRVKYDDSHHEQGGSSGKASLKRKHPQLPWRNGLAVNSKKKSSNTVIEISDSSSSYDSESSDSDFDIPKKKRRSNPTSASNRNRSFKFDELDAETQEDKSVEKQSIFHRNETVLDVVESAKNGKIVIHNELNKLLKPHQIDGIKHMYNCCYGSVNGRLDARPKKGSGCILAHCMGLGKTLQLIALLHTVINYPEFSTNRILILCPKSTLSNWKAEINKWIGSIRKTRRLKVFEFSDSRSKDKQLDKLDTWSKFNEKSENAACFLISYESFRSLVFYGQASKKALKRGAKGNSNVNNIASAKVGRVQAIVQRTLLNATDLIVCDEGHMIKNLGSVINEAVRKLRTPRRIVLTGTPMQNNLMEYYAMVNFVKPSFLGTPKEFRYMYATPIEKGQHRDSSSTDIRKMRMQAFTLNNELKSFVHRREVSFLMKELPEKLEYVLYIPMSSTQVSLYEHYLVENPYSFGSKKLFADYTALRKIWTHPKQLEISFDKAIKRQTNTFSFIVATPDAENDAYDANDESDGSENPTTSINRDWWRPFVSDDEINSILLSPKFEVMFEILKQAELRSEKCLIFSTSVVCLNIVEFFLKRNGSWIPERDYYRLDGSTKNFQRNKMIVDFNKSQNTRVKAFLISAKAGGQGINLTAANRIILLDTSWNPSVDQQSIFRIFRFGQTKNCYIYRLLAMGTMEEKIYSRSVTKQAMSFRVIDKQQIDRNYSTAELAELYTFTKPDISAREIPIKPKDELLDNLLHKFPTKVFKYLKHESLLDNKYEEELTEEEKLEATLTHEMLKNKAEKQTLNTKAAIAAVSLDLTDTQAEWEEDPYTVDGGQYRASRNINELSMVYPTAAWSGRFLQKPSVPFATQSSSYLGSPSIYQPAAGGRASASQSINALSTFYPPVARLDTFLQVSSNASQSRPLATQSSSYVVPPYSNATQSSSYLGSPSIYQPSVGGQSSASQNINQLPTFYSTAARLDTFPQNPSDSNSAQWEPFSVFSSSYNKRKGAELDGSMAKQAKRSDYDGYFR